MLVKCLLTDSQQAQTQIQLILIFLHDGRITIKGLKAKLTAKVCGLLETSSGVLVKLWNFDLSWCKNICHTS